MAAAAGENLWFLGVIFSFLSSLAGIVGINLQKQSFVLEDERPEADRRPWFLQPRWIAGILMLVFLNSGLSIVAYAFAEQSILAPMASISIILSIIVTPLFVPEDRRTTDYIAAFLITSAVAGMLVFGDHTNQSYSYTELAGFFTTEVFIIYAILVVFVMCAFTVLMYFRWREYGGTDRMTRRLTVMYFAFFAGACGGFQQMFTKAAVELVKDAIAGELALSYFFSWVIIFGAVSTVLIQLFVLDEGLKYCPALSMIPLYQTFLVLTGISTALVYFQEFRNFTPLRVIMYSVACFIILCGVGLLCVRPDTTKHKSHSEDFERVGLLSAAEEPPSVHASSDDTSSDPAIRSAVLEA